MKKIMFAFCLLLLVLATAVLISAQTGGGFDLTWSTVDGGGGSSSSGGDFALSGTIGQPDAGELAGGGYALNGGFWQCVVPVVTTPGIAAVSGAIQLSWTGPTANIYRAVNDPYFTPGAAYATAVASIWPDPDAGAVGNTTNNYTYIIRASGSCGESANSQHLGEFDFAIVPGS